MDYPYDNYTMNMTNETYFSTTELMYDDMPENDTVIPRIPTGFRICNQPNTAFWSLLLCLGTFVIAVTLRKLRHSKFFGKKVRYWSVIREYASAIGSDRHLFVHCLLFCRDLV